jgi:hypothetical protein
MRLGTGRAGATLDRCIPRDGPPRCRRTYGLRSGHRPRLEGRTTPAPRLLYVDALQFRRILLLLLLVSGAARLV